ncbi:hemerythrin domain-containing protein [Pararhizobium sp. LjRoot238]|uniref:hemerythrin domain-containing protein n=1 Tax=Pararhizobium sp. LjRoot238 TaxID=3342293 RepID=UPI003F5019D2
MLSPLQEMFFMHEQKLALCGTLEGIADSLPDRIERLTCLTVASALLPLLNRAHHLEETIIFPAYDALPDAAKSAGTTQRLRIEHVEDECFADDLTEILFKVGHEGVVANAEMFGFMLRGFFEGMRRHVAFESEHIAPIVRGVLAKAPHEI